MELPRPSQWGISRKILTVTLAVSIALWLLLDSYQSRQLRELFLEKEYKALQQGAFDDRLLFDQYAQGISRSAKLIVGLKRFLDFVEVLPPVEVAPAVVMVHQSALPGWMPRSSLMRTFYRARYALLYDQRGFLRAAYHHGAEHEGREGLPQELLSNSSVLRKLSHNQSYMTMIADTPYLLASERVHVGAGEITLALVVPIDSEFLAAVSSAQHHRNVLALVEREQQFIVASSDVARLPQGALVSELERDYLMAGKSFFDYGASDLNLQLSSFAPKAEVIKTTEGLLATSNYQRAVLVLAMLFTFFLVMLVFVRRVQSLSRNVNHFSRHILGRDIGGQGEGDELTMLGRQIHTLGSEVVILRNELRGEVEHAQLMAADLEARTDSLIRTNQNLAREIAERERGEAERDLLHTQLQKAQRMDAIGQITGGVAHDFNNILASILGYADLAEGRFGKREESGALSRYLEQITHAGERGRDLVASMMAFSRGEAGERRVLALEQELEGVIGMLRPTISSSIEIQTVVHDENLFVEVDPIKLNQLVMNLMVNARDAMAQEKGWIEVAVGRVTLDACQCDSCHEEIGGDYIELSVTDSGQGISAEILGNIFEPFFSTKDVGKGSGMGLSVIHGILHANHGHVLVDSEPGRGTCFRLLFAPASEVVVEATSEVTTGQGTTVPPGAVAQVMVVDDEIALTSFLKELLTLQGYEVEVFNDPSLALIELAREPQRYDLLITDQTMPQLTGVELTEEVRKFNQTIPVVMCTGYSATTSEASARERGVDEYLTKPVDSKRLLQSVERLLRERQGAR